MLLLFGAGGVASAALLLCAAVLGAVAAAAAPAAAAVVFIFHAGKRLPVRHITYRQPSLEGSCSKLDSRRGRADKHMQQAQDGFDSFQLVVLMDSYGSHKMQLFLQEKGATAAL